MPYDRKPSNWWNMDYDERKEWERNRQAFEDAEYDRQRAQQAADDAQAEVQRMRRARQVADEEAGYLQEELSTLNENYERILKQRNNLRDALIWLVKVNSDDAGKPLNDAAENGQDVLNTLDGD